MCRHHCPYAGAHLSKWYLASVQWRTYWPSLLLCAITEIWNFHLADMHTYYCWFPSLLVCILTISELKACYCAIERLLITSFASVQKIAYWAVPLLLCKCSNPCQHASFLLLLITFLAVVQNIHYWTFLLLICTSYFIELVSCLCTFRWLVSKRLATVQQWVCWVLLMCWLPLIE